VLYHLRSRRYNFTSSCLIGYLEVDNLRYQMTQFQILVGSYTDEIYTLLFDDARGSLDVVSTVKVGHHPSWIAFHPSDRSIVFTALEQSDGTAMALRFDEEGRGEVICKTESGGKDPCSLVATADELLIANVSNV